MSLEALLLAKTRKLEHDVTMGRLALAEATQELEAAREQVRGCMRMHDGAAWQQQGCRCSMRDWRVERASL